MKSIPVTGRGELQLYEKLRIPHSLESLLRDGGKVANLRRQPGSSPETLLFCFWHSFMLEAE
jgi:hypothetical protein